MPAYIADLFGQKYTGIHGRGLTAWGVAPLLGPTLTKLRQTSYTQCIEGVIKVCDPESFRIKFGAAIERWKELLELKTITISKVMEIVPEGIIDPSLFLYNFTLYSMGIMLTLAVICWY